MKLLLVCASGMSTSMVKKKLEVYAEEHDMTDFTCEAQSISSLEENYKDFDLVLYAPQVANRLDSMREIVGEDYPLAKIEPMDYALGKAENIFNQIEDLLA